MTDTIIEKLKSYGYGTVEPSDIVIINLLRSDVEQYIKHYCNICEIPPCLENVIVEMVCGKFLQVKKTTGQMEQLGGVLKAVRDGETQVEYNVSCQADPEATFLVFVDKLINGHNEQLIRHRRLCW